MFRSIIALAALTLANTALAGVYCTSPVASTVATGGQVLNVNWADDGQTPTVASIGPCSVDLYTGSVNAQTFLQNLAASVDVSKASSISATIDPSVGQTGAYYFVRFSSLSLKSTTNPEYPYEAFSAIFAIDSMTGTFNQSVLAEISGGASSVVASATGTTVSAAKSTAASTTKAGSSSAPSASSSHTSGSNAVLAIPAGLVVLLAGAASFFGL